MRNLGEQRVLFVSHEASRTGAPVLLLRLLRWLRANTNVDFEVVLRLGGELSAEFAELAPLWQTESFERRVTRPTMRIARSLGLTSVAEDAAMRRMVHDISKLHFGLVYSNTFTNGSLVARLRELGCPVLTHVHELESGIRRAGDENLRLVKAQTSRYLACAEAVKSNLIVRHGIDRDRIDVVHGFVECRDVGATVIAQARARARSELGIPDSAHVVGASGTTNWAKSPDLFVQLAHAVDRRRPSRPVHFVWVGGGSPQDHRLAELRLDAETAGVGNIVHFPGSRREATEYFCAFDVFALVSREDSYPLVCLEAASLAKPILCFDRAGGEREFVEEDCGFVVPYLQVEMMAERTLELLGSDELRHRMGERAKAKVRERHDVSVSAPRILEVIRRLL
jgi:glycosyltransferase involved in cell wall biosynthesis